MDSQLISKTSVIVLDNHTPGDVAKSMIEEGRQKEPFYIFDMDEVYRRVEYFRKMMPRVEMFYAMKANDSDKMIKLAAALGLGFDCASPGEIRKILELGVSPESIIFAAPSKTPDWMMYARQSGVRHTTFDSSYELKKVKQYWPDVGLLIRIKVESDSIYKLGDKFGCDFETEATDLLEEAASLGLKVVGVAFHVGSSCSSAHSHVEGLQNAKALFDYEVRAGRGMNIVDIGGGFLSDRIDRIDQVSKLINTTLEELFPERSIQIIAEPGRYLCDTSCNLYCNINNIRRATRGGEKVNMIYLNDGLYGSLRYSDPWQKVKRFGRHESIINEKLEKTILWGPSCDSMDQVMQNVDVMLPACTPLDWLIFNSQGAYTFGFATQFSCLPTPQMRSVVSQVLWAKLKDSKVFSEEDFEQNPDISAPLPSSLPPIVKMSTFVKSNTLKTN
ncbi:ornithine decarboxylase 2-like [Maniola hyperantus]|uniref:ornithine decarboxylase 2-like n=1 Tax=Aphantopus hyperantus TaxID=2795564 RepID=UPI001568F1B7|nr:ornithine decarboxylase 2-like isoform X3 [Maniola hyperantus]XP_034825013.1 ornithine decarboxylase 2-like isoform X3 [Maniola hyperantus]